MKTARVEGQDFPEEVATVTLMLVLVELVVMEVMPMRFPVLAVATTLMAMELLVFHFKDQPQTEKVEEVIPLAVMVAGLKDALALHGVLVASVMAAAALV